VTGRAARHEDDRVRLEQFWNRSRPYYELAMATNPEAAAERLELFGRLGGGERVLDLGSGSCENALWLPEGCRYLGMDISTTALAMADEAGRPGRRVRSDARSLPFADGSFDAVISTWVVEHLHDPGATFAEVARVLRPGGQLLLVGSAWDLPYAIPPSVEPGRRWTVAARRLVRQLRSWLDGRHRFEVVLHPRALREAFVPDADAVHVTQSFLLARYLRALGFEPLEIRPLPHGEPPSGLRGAFRRALARCPLWRGGWGNLFLVARRGAELRHPSYELRSI
jgi:SAM-dependent methyltransferase